MRRRNEAEGVISATFGRGNDTPSTRGGKARGEAER
jgi:hypothetical protein